MTMAYCFFRSRVSLTGVAAMPGALPAPTAAMVPAAKKPRRLTLFCLSSFTEISIRMMDSSARIYFGGKRTAPSEARLRSSALTMFVEKTFETGQRDYNFVINNKIFSLGTSVFVTVR